jgi:Ni,Fe-hydrogenase maturation factor
VGIGSINMVKPDDVLEKYEFNQFVVEHKVQEHELIKLKEENVNYAEIIKENMAKNCARDFVKKLSFSKKHDKDKDVHSFRGRVWVFTREELVQLIDDVKQGKV